MRSCLMALLLTVVLGSVALWLTLPMLAGYVIQAGLGVSGFHGTGTSVEVKADPPFIVLIGHADSVHLTSTDVSVADLRADRVDLRLDGVAVISRHAAAVHGSFEGVEVVAAKTAGQTEETVVVELQKVTLEGPSNRTSATIVMSGEEAARLAQAQLKAATGINATVALKAPDVVTLMAGGKTETGHLVVKDGALILQPDAATLPTLTLMKPGSGNPFSLDSAVVGTDSTGADILTLTGTIEIQALLD
jgi:hypothetical protein